MKGKCKCGEILDVYGDRVVCDRCEREYYLMRGVWYMRTDDGRLITNPVPKR